MVEAAVSVAEYQVCISNANRIDHKKHCTTYQAITNLKAQRFSDLEELFWFCWEKYLHKDMCLPRDNLTSYQVVISIESGV